MEFSNDNCAIKDDQSNTQLAGVHMTPHQLFHFDASDFSYAHVVQGEEEASRLSTRGMTLKPKELAELVQESASTWDSRHINIRTM